MWYERPRATALSCVRSAGVAVAVALLLRLLREVAVAWGGRQGGGRTHDPELELSLGATPCIISAT
jgi:hypothetical protein